MGYSISEVGEMERWDEEEIPALTALQQIVNPKPAATSDSSAAEPTSTKTESPQT
jgi:hypothetical protein